MADITIPARTRVRFAVHPRTASGRLLEPVQSPTEWTDSQRPCTGDTVVVIHEGKPTPARCGPAAITWERIDGATVQVFTVRVEVGS